MNGGKAVSAILIGIRRWKIDLTTSGAKVTSSRITARMTVSMRGQAEHAPPLAEEDFASQQPPQRAVGLVGRLRVPPSSAL